MVLGGGGAGAYYYFQSPAEASAATDEHVEAAKKKKSPENFKYVELNPLILPIVDEYGVSQVLSLVISLEVYDEKALEKVEKYKPRLKDAYITDMYGILNKHAAVKGGVVQVDQLKKRLNLTSNKVVGKKLIHDVLLQVIQQRPI